VFFMLYLALSALLLSACSSDGGGGDGNSTQTDAATPVISQLQNASYSQNASASLSVTASVSDGGTLSYQWYRNTANSNSGGEAIPPATSATYAPVPTNTVGTFYYYVVVTNTNLNVSGSPTATAVSNTAVITVNVPGLTDAQTPVISILRSASYTQNATASLRVTVGISDGGTLSYQWYSNTIESNEGGTAIPSATSAIYTVPTGVVGNFYYYVAVTNTNNYVNGERTAVAVSNAAVISISATNAQTPVILTQPKSKVYGQYTGVYLSVTAGVIDGGTLSYQWYNNTIESNEGGTAITSATSAIYSVPTDAIGTSYYYAVITNNNPGASGSKTADITSATAVITVNAGSITNAQTPVISVQPQSAAYSQNNVETLNVTAGVSDGGTLSYQWYKNITNSNIGGTPVASTQNYTVPTDTIGTSYYYVVITNENTNVNGVQTAEITSDVAVIAVASSVTHAAYFYESGTLTHIEPVASAQNIALHTPVAISGWSFDGWYIDEGGFPL
jgi:hypothetical protein